MNSKRTKNRKVAHREAAHHEPAYGARHASVQSHGSPASKGASIGPGPVAGAGELAMPGPGPAAARISGLPMNELIAPTASSGPPKGMRTSQSPE